MGLQQVLRIGTWEKELIQRSSYKKCANFNFFMSFFVLPPGIPTSNLPILPSAESENLNQSLKTQPGSLLLYDAFPVPVIQAQSLFPLCHLYNGHITGCNDHSTLLLMFDFHPFKGCDLPTWGVHLSLSYLFAFSYLVFMRFSRQEH